VVRHTGGDFALVVADGQESVEGLMFKPDTQGYQLLEGDTICSELEMMEFLAGFVRMLKPRLVVETGCHIGLTTCKMGMALRENGSGRLVASDINAESAKMAATRCAGLPVEIRHCSSVDLPELKECDFLFCDSGYDSRIEELKLIRKPCTVVVHDTLLEPPLEEFIHGYFKDFLFFPVSRGFTIIRL
jgi:predicted O-methyltransferase YrrM